MTRAALLLLAALLLGAGCAERREPERQRVTVPFGGPMADSVRHCLPETTFARGDGQEWMQIRYQDYYVTRRPNFENGRVERDTSWNLPRFEVVRVR